MKTMIIIVFVVNLVLTIIAFAINYKNSKEPYFVKDALTDFVLSFIPVINLMYICLIIYESSIENLIKTIKFDNSKFNKFLNKRLK